MDSERVKELEAALEAEKKERTAAEGRATEADEAYRKLQADVLTIASAAPPAMTGPPAPLVKERLPKMSLPAAVIINAPQEVGAAVEQMLQRIEGLREMLALASNELSQLHADEVALHKKRTRVLSDACALLARAVGATGQAPPPIPSAALEARLSVAPVVDISEVADLIESLRPPRAPKVE